MKKSTILILAVLIATLCWMTLSTWAAPSLPITKPPVVPLTQFTGPMVDPLATNGQWFVDSETGLVEEFRTHEFYDNINEGTANDRAIFGYVSSITYQAGPGTPIAAFSILATITNDTTEEIQEWIHGDNSHGETNTFNETPYMGPLVDAKLTVEFAITGSGNLPAAWNPPYFDYQPYIEAVNEDQAAWYCWSPEDPNPEHNPAGNYYVPTWDFGTIAHKASAQRQLDFVVPGGLPSADPRYLVIVQSEAEQQDVLINRTTSLKISTWIDDIAIDAGLPYPLPPRRSSDASVFHNTGEEESQLDFGDAPDPTYPTLLANDGARHVAVAGIMMGPLIDSESDGQPNMTATGDDLANLDDEDGVVFASSLVIGSSTSLVVTVSINGYLSAWVDFNQDGTWASSEKIYSTLWITQGINNLTFSIPASATVGTTYSRFRFTTLQTTLYPTGLVTNGEVEDYEIELTEEEVHLDFGDAPDSLGVLRYPTLLIHDGARHILSFAKMGALTDSEVDGQPDATATGDDLALTDDEDGVLLSSPYYQGGTASITITTTTNGYLSAWVDFNQNNSWVDPGDKIYAAYALTTGVNNLTFFVPPTTTLGTTYSRWRFTTLSTTLYPTGLVADGEVEDYQIEFEESPFDFGDAMDSAGSPGYPTLLVNNGARHTYVPGAFMGTLIDLEPDGQPALHADGDNLANLPDEAGVTLPTVFYAGEVAQVSVSVNIPGFLDAWIDWNSNGSWADPGEQVFIQTPVHPGLNILPVAVPMPPAFVAGGPHSRWRFSSIANPATTFTGAAPDGEVEDYEVTLKIIDCGDAPAPYPTLRSDNGAIHEIPTTPVYWMGAVATDIEPDGIPEADALGDDLNNTDDEDGVVPAGTLILGSNANLNVTVSAGSYLNAWLDYNQDGDWADSGEQIVTDQIMITGLNPISFTVPLGASPGQTFGRFRLNSSGGLSYTGVANDGEVEDHTFTIYQNGPAVATNMVFTNIVRATTNEAQVWWNAETSVVYQVQFTTNLVDPPPVPWTDVGGYIIGPTNDQIDSNAVDRMHFYRVIAPFSPPPP